MMRRLTVCLLILLMGPLVGSVMAARPDSVELRDRSGSLGVLPVQKRFCSFS